MSLLQRSERQKERDRHALASADGPGVRIFRRNRTPIISHKILNVKIGEEKMKKNNLTDEDVEKEIARLLADPHVKLAKKEELIRYRRRQYLYKLRGYEKKGKELAESGITMEMLEALAKQCNEES